MASFGTPACSIFCSTAVIAPAFCFCASAEFFERDSAAMVTNARSGRAVTIAVPRVTIDGGCAYEAAGKPSTRTRRAGAVYCMAQFTVERGRVGGWRLTVIG